MPAPRKVRYLILLQPCRVEGLASPLIPSGGFIPRWDRRGMVPRSVCQHLLAKPGFLVDFQHVDAEMWNIAGNGLLNRISPALLGLVREPSNQINIDHDNASGTQPRNLSVALLLRMQSANSC